MSDQSENSTVADEIRAEASKLGIEAKKPEPQETHTDDDEESKSTEEDTNDSDESDKDEESDDDDSEEQDESEDDEDGDDEDSEEETETEARRPRKYIPKADYDRRKATWEAEKKQLQADLDKAKSRTAGPSEARKKLYEDLKAADPKFNPSNLDQIFNAIRDEIAETTGNIPKELQDKINAVSEFMESQKSSVEQEQKIKTDRHKFNEGWNDMQDELTRAFPKMTDDEREAAKTLLGKIWRTKEFYKADVFRVFQKNRAKFEEIMSPHGLGLETGRSQGHVSTGKKIKLSNNPSAKELQIAEKMLADAVGEEEEFTTLDDRLD